MSRVLLHDVDADTSVVVRPKRSKSVTIIAEPTVLGEEEDIEHHCVERIELSGIQSASALWGEQTWSLVKQGGHC